MEKKRMFRLGVLETDAFMDMPLSTQALYFHLNLRADDDGFVGNPKLIVRTIGANQNDLDILIAKRFVLTFDDGVIVIKHWRLHNILSANRYSATKYIEDKEMLKIKKNNAYTFSDDGKCMDDSHLESVSKRQISDRRTIDEQKTSADKDSIGKVSIDKNIDLSKDKSSSDRMTDYDAVISLWNELDGYGNIKTIRSINDGSKRKDNVRARLKQFGLNGFKDAIENIKQSDFLQGKSKKGWTITFDWFVLPSNFPKVLEGNYNRDSCGNDSEWSQYLDG